MSNHLTEEEYLEMVNAYIDSLRANVASLTVRQLRLSSNSFAFNGNSQVIDQTLIVEGDDSFGMPLPYGWIAVDAHFTGLPDQDYYLDNIIYVDHQGED